MGIQENSDAGEERDRPPEQTQIAASIGEALFVGRQAEMELLKAAVRDAAAGEGRLAMLVGEPGIGKTRMARELAVAAAAQDMRVLWGWCYEEEGAPPYWPWIQPIRTYVQETSADRLRSEMGVGAADIAGIVGDVHEKLPGLETPPALEPEQARFRLFDSVTTFLKNASRSQPIMLVLDDLHWADRPSLLLLQFLARQIDGSRLLIVGCYRDQELTRQHPLSESLAQLARMSTFRRYVLPGLGVQDIGQFIQRAANVSPSREWIEAIHARTEGNPFYMTEVVRLLLDRGESMGEAVVGNEAALIPEGVREVIGQRLNRLSEDCVDVLTTAAVVGKEFSAGVVAILTDNATKDRFLQLIEEATKAHLLVESEHETERYQFSHALTQSTLLAGLPASRLVRLHGRVGEVLETFYGADADDHAAELAYHFQGAVPIMGPAKSVHYSRLAGEQAMVVHAHEDALEHFSRALGHKQGLDVDAETAALLFGIGQAQAAVHRRREAVESLTRAFDYYAGAGDVDRAVAVVEYPFPPGMGRRRVSGLISRALLLVPEGSLASGRLLSRYGLALSTEMGVYEESQQAFARALDIAQKPNDVALEMRTLVSAAQTDFFHLHWRESAEKGLRATELALKIDDPQAEADSRFHTWAAMGSSGETDGAARQASAGLAPAERGRDRSQLTSAIWCNEQVSGAAGDWKEALALSDRALHLSPGDPRLLATRVLLEYQTGNFSEGGAHLDQLIHAMHDTPPGPSYYYAFTALVIALADRIGGSNGKLNVCQEAGDTVLSSESAVPYFRIWARAGLGLKAASIGDAAAAAEIYAPLNSARGVILWATCTDRVLGLLAQTMGDLEAAVGHFEDGVALTRRAGHRPELAWTCRDYGSALMQRGLPNDRSNAGDLLDEAAAIAKDLGMHPLSKIVAVDQVELESIPEKAAVFPDRLTPREVEVLRLIASGESNRGISDRLVLAEGTTRRHINNIYQKIGVTNRAEATVYALRNGLLTL